MTEKKKCPCIHVNLKFNSLTAPPPIPSTEKSRGRQRKHKVWAGTSRGANGSHGEKSSRGVLAPGGANLGSARKDARRGADSASLLCSLALFRTRTTGSPVRLHLPAPRPAARPAWEQSGRAPRPELGSPVWGGKGSGEGDSWGPRSRAAPVPGPHWARAPKRGLQGH